VGNPALLGIVPIAEGQIALPPGLYSLTVIPGPENRIFRGDVDPDAPWPDDYAVAPNNTNGDVIVFEVLDECPTCPPEIVFAASRRRHGAAGTFDLPVPLDTRRVTEPRENGAAPQFVVSYDGEPTDPGCAGIAITKGICLGTVVSGNDLLIDMQFDTNACVEITILSETFSVLALTADVVPDGVVNVVDLQAIKDHLFDPVDEENFIYDINVDGVKNIIDLMVAKGNIFARASCPVD
jgi:hypothetical protein